ncbi:hypothetical protein GCM10010149_45740 [Nonomuraea roseoviolacea subsp. roseoviolacea]|uniref:WXG100 family type VII secretion target n=1 Tax=Nonomuraea roseoviolacea subsp. carminata TaxID=160689 RepID=A0ABT1JZH4_9ACTN|nr:hypothetical protein [Nonomuraea roseoviolacea]MCP2347147.1 hypothetical protein [Nonomuraea roseoviolacea subsp. carminata]
MAEPPPDPPSRPSIDFDHDQLRKKAAPAFDAAAEAWRRAVREAYAALDALGGWPAHEEADKAFVEWYKPKRDEMRHWTTDFAKVYEDIADGILTMRANTAKVDWGIADDLNLSDVPVYDWPKGDTPW